MRALVVGFVLLLVLPAAAGARVALVATGGADVALLDVGAGQVVARVPVAAPVRAVAITLDGRRGFAAGGSVVAALDLSGPLPAPPAATPGGAATVRSARAAALRAASRDVGAPVAGIGVSPHGSRLYVAAGRRLLVLDATTLRTLGSTRLKGTARSLAVSRDGALLAVPLRGSRVALLGSGQPRLLRRFRVPGATAAAFAGGRAWVTGRGGLYAIRPGARKAAKPRRLGRGAGGGVAASPDGTMLAVGARAGGARGALVDVRTGRVRGFLTGSGPGAPGWSPDGVRVFLAEPAVLSLVSPFAGRRIGTLKLGGHAIVVQPGLARTAGTDLADRVTGGRLRDAIEGLAGDDVLFGGRENDVLRGGEGNDRLSGDTYDDLLYGGDGDDHLSGGQGNDRLHGEAGADRALAGTGDDSVHGGDGDDVLDGGAGDDRIFGEGGDDRIDGGIFGNDGRLYGGPGDDEIHGGRGGDRLIKGGDGNDRLFGETGTENISGGEGDDLVDGGRARDLLFGSNGNDTVKGDAGDDLAEGGAGADVVDGGSGADELAGGDGADTVIGGPEPDEIDAGAGDNTVRVADSSQDVVDCGDGDDTVFVEEAAPARDVLTSCETVLPVPAELATDVDPPSVIAGTSGRDVLRGTPGPDSLFGKGGADRLFGGGGDDYVDGEYGPDELHGGVGDDTMAGRANDDRIFGDAGDDRITGDRGEDRIAGGAGNDEIFGNLDPDVISGGSGADRINVVRGDVDVVRCGSGRDVVLADPQDRVARDCEDVRR